MRFRIPPFLPPYAVLFLVVAYAVGSLWFGLTRLDGIARLTESTAQNAGTMHDLQDLINAVNDIETAGRAFALTADDSDLELFERSRRRVPVLLSSLRDRVRDDASELALIEELVPLVAERTTITASRIERKRSAPDQPYETMVGRRGRESSDAIRSIVASLEAREQDQLAQGRQTLVRTIGEARRDLYVMAALTLLLVMSLFLAVRRLRSFIPFAPKARGARTAAAAMAPEASPDAKDSGVGTLLRDAMLRTRLAASAAPADSPLRSNLQALVAAVEQALTAHAGVYDGERTRPAPQGFVEAIAALGQNYSRRDGVTIEMTIDRSARVRDTQEAFLIFRSAEWALEAIALRKRAGNVTLALAAGEDRLFLRVHALTDNPELPVTLTPKETEEANALRQGAAALAGTFVVGEGPTGFSLTLTLPAHP